MSGSGDLELWDIPTADAALARGGKAPVQVHPTAIVSPQAKLGVGVEIGPYSVIGPEVVLQDHVRISSHVVIEGRTTVGERSVVHPFATLGAIPQDLKYKGEPGQLVIGAENSIRHYVNMSIGTEGGGGKTVTGRRNLFMVNVHVAHDCVVQDNCIFANGVSLAGHVYVDAHAVLGGHSAIHQFCRVGEGTMVGGGSMVVQDIPPWVMVQGDRAKPIGLNVVGLRRAGLSTDELKDLKTMYRLLYSEGLTVEDSIARIEQEAAPSVYRDKFVGFLKASKRGVCR
jgi:UDP-N-acetylglucosamine acyltransferase